MMGIVIGFLIFIIGLFVIAPIGQSINAADWILILYGSSVCVATMVICTNVIIKAIKENKLK